MLHVWRDVAKMEYVRMWLLNFNSHCEINAILRLHDKLWSLELSFKKKSFPSQSYSLTSFLQHGWIKPEPAREFCFIRTAVHPCVIAAGCSLSAYRCSEPSCCLLCSWWAWRGSMQAGRAAFGRQPSASDLGEESTFDTFRHKATSAD